MIHKRVRQTSNYAKQSSLKLLKYFPTPQQANLILAYFVYNNFQDFNTWQQISKTKCEFEYLETKHGSFECRAILKWDDPIRPIIAQSAQSKTKRNGKKKVLRKLIEQLIYQGFIGYGFKDTDFISKLPRRRKESTSSESDNKNERSEGTGCVMDQQQLLEMLDNINPSNFIRIWHYALKKQDLELCLRAIRRVQGQDDSELLLMQQEVAPLEQWQDYSQGQLKYFEGDLTDLLTQYQFQCAPQKKQGVGNSWRPSQIQLMLPVHKPTVNNGNASFQFFHPIENCINYLRNRKEENSFKPSWASFTHYFAEFNKVRALPRFAEELRPHLLHYQTVEQIYESVLAYSFNFSLVFNVLQMLSSFNTSNAQLEQVDVYLRNKNLLASEFAYVLYRKCMHPSLTLEGMIQLQKNSHSFTFHPKQPESILQQKIVKKGNWSEFEEMREFAVQEYVLLVSKIDATEYHMGVIEEIYPKIKVKAQLVIEHQEKYPFTMYKLANSKVYQRLSKLLVRGAKINLSSIRNKVCILRQPPTYPLLQVIYELVAQWIASNETILIISENSHELACLLTQAGFQAANVSPKLQEKVLIRNQVVCSCPTGILADVLKNYAYTRVLIEAAQCLNEVMVCAAIDKGCQKLYLLGDQMLPTLPVLSPHSVTGDSFMVKQLQVETESITLLSEMQCHQFDRSILELLNKYFYANRLNMHVLESPIIKGFPWPCPQRRFAFINCSKGSRLINRQAELCTLIVSSVLSSGFIVESQINCRVPNANSGMILTAKLRQMLEGCHSYLKIKPEASRDLVQLVSGSRFKQRDLCIFMAARTPLTAPVLNAILQEGRRGVVVIGDIQQFASSDPIVSQLVHEAYEHQMILSYTG